MKAMILAAGLGKRMLPLTRERPKPLLPVGGKPLIQHLVERLYQAGITELVINVAYLGEQIQGFLGDGKQFGVSILYSPETRPLETGGAVNLALPRLGAEPFLLVNGDVWTDYDFSKLLSSGLAERVLGHIVLVPNPAHNPGGDFSIGAGGQVDKSGDECLTYSGISLLTPELVADYPRRREIFPLREAFDYAVEQRRLTGEVYRGDWQDIGTPERLAALDLQLRGASGE